MTEVNSLSIIDQADMTTFKSTMQKINQWQRLVQTNLKEGKDYGTIPGTQKPTLYKAGAEKIVMLGKLRSTFEVLDETKDWDNEFFQFEVQCNLWVGDNIITQGVGLCSSKEDKYRYRWIPEKKLPSNMNKDTLFCKELNGKYGKYKVYRVENEDICSIANTILKMSKKRALVDAALLVGSLSELFTQDVEDLPEEYLGTEKATTHDNKDNSGNGHQEAEEVISPTNNDPASDKQIALINKQILDSHLLKNNETDRLRAKIENGITKTEASKTISWWLGDPQKFIIGERKKREEAEVKVKPVNKGKLEIKDVDAEFPVEDDEQGSSFNNAIPFKGKKKTLKKVSEAEDFISEEYEGPDPHDLVD